MRFARPLAALLSFASILSAATFGTVVAPAGGAAYSDIVLDEARSRLYLVNSAGNRLEIYNLKTKTFLPSIATDLQPVSAALSRDGNSLFVTAYTSATLDVIDLNASVVTNRVSLPTNPEGVAVGADGRALITAVAVGGGTVNTLLIFNPAAIGASNLISVPLLPPASTPPVLPTPSGRIFVSYRSRLLATPDGKWIIGANGTSATGKAVFVYESASGTVLRSRNVTNLSTTLAVTADGAKFMAGSTLFDAQTLQVMAQENAANASFSFGGTTAPNFNTQQNEGGSAFTPDGKTLYAAFNIAPIGAARPQISELMVNDPDNLLINLGIQMPENLAGKMVSDAAGANIYALSDSGFILLPVSTIAQSPLALPHTQTLLLTNDVCGVFKAVTASDTIDNAGKGRVTIAATPILTTGAGAIPFPGQGPGAPAATVPAPTTTVVNTGATPLVNFRFNNAAALSPGTVGPSDVMITSPEAINIPGNIHVFQNNRDSVSSGTIVPIALNQSSAEGLTDLLLDTVRQRVYLTNSGLNRIEVFDIKTKTLLTPIKVGQLPHGMAMGLDGTTLYVANTGGESISIVDLTKGVQTGRVAFPPLPFNAAVGIATPVAIAASARGPQFVMSDGSFWKVDSSQAIPRALNASIFGTARAIPAGNPALYSMASTPGGEYIFLLTGTGTGYLYDYTVDDITLAKTVISPPLVGYAGAITAGPQGRYYTVGGTVLNSSLTPVQGSTNGISPSGRLVPAVTAVSATQVAEFTIPVRANPTAAAPDAGQIELYDPLTGASAGASPTLEGPPATSLGLARLAAFARTLAVDPSGPTAYVLSTTGLSVVSLKSTPANAALKPSVNPGGIVSLGDYEPTTAPGGLFTIFGKNLGSTQIASAPLPTLLGGVCLTLNNQPIPLEMTSAGQINAQIPVTLAPGKYPLVIRSIDNQAISTTSTVTVSKYAPAVLVDGTHQPAIFHSDGSYVTKDHAARRDENLTLYATGLGVTHGGAVTTGAAAPDDPLALTDPVLVYFGNPSFKQSQMIVRSSNLLPGIVGISQITITVPGFHQKGAALPVTLKIGGVSSSTAGPAVPYVSVN